VNLFSKVSRLILYAFNLIILLTFKYFSNYKNYKNPLLILMVKQVKRMLPLKCFLAIDSIDSFAISAKHANVAYNCGKLTVLNILTGCAEHERFEQDDFWTRTSKIYNSCLHRNDVLFAYCVMSIITNIFLRMHILSNEFY